MKIPFCWVVKEDLFSLQARVNNRDACEGVHFRLTRDIAINEGLDLSLEWIPLGMFAGTLDGAGHAITGMYVPYAQHLLSRCIDDGTAILYHNSENGEDYYVLPKEKSAIIWGSGFIAQLDGKVRNLTVSGRVEPPHYSGETPLGGGICADNNGMIDNCTSTTFY